jgi:hypothetical protein
MILLRMHEDCIGYRAQDQVEYAGNPERNPKVRVADHPEAIA